MKYVIKILRYENYNPSTTNVTKAWKILLKYPERDYKKCEQGMRNGTKYKGKDKEWSTKNVNMVQKMCSVQRMWPR